jgi:hypothetical protein
MMHIYVFLLHGLLSFPLIPPGAASFCLYFIAWRLEAICFVCFVFGSFSSDIMSLSILWI